MAREHKTFNLRMPANLRTALEKSSDAARRSMNAELVMRLEHSLASEPVVLVEDRVPVDYAKLAPPRVIREARRAGRGDDEQRLLSLWRQLTTKERRALLTLLDRLAE